MTEPLATHNSSLDRTDWMLIGALLALVLPLRLWLLCNTEVTARDSIGYIRYALQFEKKPWQEVLVKNHQHPGYPVLVWLVSVPVRALDGEATPENMELSAQLVNLIASLLLILPMYKLGRQFFDPTVCFWATLLYQYLPISAQHLSDGISEPIFLVLFLSALLQAVKAIHGRRIWPCVGCGLCTGLAYLTRPEGALILPAFVGVLVILQLRSEWRCAWPRFLACGTTAVLTAALVGSIYVAATGHITNKLSAIETLGNLVKMLEEIFRGQGSQAAANGSLHLFAASFPMIDNKALRLFRSVWALISEVTQGFHYVAALSCLLGFWWSFGSLRRLPGFWVLMAFTGLYSLILIALAMSVNYVSDRHVMILVLLGCFFVVVSLRELPRRVLAWCKTNEISDTPSNARKVWYRSEPVWFGILLFALIACCLPKATQRLHGNRVGNREAGVWLSKHLKEGDHVEDDHAWSHFFSGSFFKEGCDPELPPDLVPTCYVVITPSRDPQIEMHRQNSFVSKLATVEYIAKNAKVEYVWPDHADSTKARVVIYSQLRDWDKQRWRKASQ